MHGRRVVRRRTGLLVRGFSKQLDLDTMRGMTYLWGVPVGRFRIVRVDGDGHELRYVRWPIVDELRGPIDGDVTLDGAGFIRGPKGRRARFCRFALEPRAVAE